MTKRTRAEAKTHALAYSREYNKTYAGNKNKLIKAELVSYYGNKCFDCGNVYPPCVYDFHHLDAKTKSFAVSVAGTFEEAFEESKKCIMICSNCHRIRHAKEL